MASSLALLIQRDPVVDLFDQDWRQVTRGQDFFSSRNDPL